MCLSAPQGKEGKALTVITCEFPATLCVLLSTSTSPAPFCTPWCLKSTSREAGWQHTSPPTPAPSWKYSELSNVLFSLPRELYPWVAHVSSLQATLEVQSWPKGWSEYWKISFPDERCGLWVTQSQGQALGRKGAAASWEGVSPGWMTTVYKGADTGENQALWQPNLQRHTALGSQGRPEERAWGWGGPPTLPASSVPGHHLATWGVMSPTGPPMPWKEQLLAWFLPGSDRQNHGRGRFLYKAVTLWGQGATVIQLYGKALQKPFCLSQTPVSPLFSWVAGPRVVRVRTPPPRPCSPVKPRPWIRTGLDRDWSLQRAQA